MSPPKPPNPLEGPSDEGPERASRADGPDALDGLVRLHLALGWLGLLVFVVLGVALEALHGLKAPWLLDAGNETRRLFLRLGHAHGALLSLVQIAFALTLRAEPRVGSPLASRALVVATLSIPGGFVLGAVSARGADPGPLVLLVPAGALALVTALALVLAGLARRAPRA